MSSESISNSIFYFKKFLLIGIKNLFSVFILLVGFFGSLQSFGVSQSIGTVQGSTVSNAKVGDWIQGCYASGDVESDPDYLSGIALIDQKEFLWFTFAYEDENCKQAYLIFSRKFKTLNLENSKFEVTSVTYRSLTDEVTEALNLIAFCGFTDWETYQEREVAGLECGDYKPARKGELQSVDLRLEEDSLYIDRGQIEYRRIQYAVL